MRRLLSVALVLLAAVPLLQAQMTADQKSLEFQQIAGLFDKRYSFLEWKWDNLGFDGLNIGPWLERVANSKDDLEYFDICAQYIAGFQDSHTRFALPSDFEARLGLNVDDYGGKILLDSIDQNIAELADFPFHVGDELIALDGVSPEELIKAYRPFTSKGTRGLRAGWHCPC